MRFISKFILVLLILVLYTGVPAVSGAESSTEEATQESTIPDSVDMTLGVVESEYVMPEGFRGSDAPREDIHWLEDVGYLMAENSNLYNTDGVALAENAEFEGPPNITWTISSQDDSGNMQPESVDNNNVASKACNITEPGYYEVHNGGARRVSDSGGAVEDDSIEGNTDSSEDLATTGQNSEEGNEQNSEEGNEASGGESKTVTAQQRVGIHVHDCTSPDIWIAFQEGAGMVDMAETEEELKKQVAEQIVANRGRPFSNKPEDYEKASYLFIDEGEENERNAVPWKKTARLSIAGPLFNERGALKYETGIVPARINKQDYTNAVTILGGEDRNLKGVFVRRNVPFIFAAMASDNGNKRATAGLAVAQIVDADGNEVEKNGNGYLFRVPNYPRERYPDQPEYFFTAFSADQDGNSVSLRMPLYIVDTQAAFEGGRNE